MHTITTHTEVEIKPLTPLRKIIAARMVEAKQTIPHYRISMSIRMDAVIAQRKTLNTRYPNAKVSLNDFVIKACATALVAMPEINCQFIDNQIHQYGQADISVIVAVEGGLSTPVVRDAGNKSVKQIAQEVKELVTKAAQGKLKMAEISGGTFSISNLGKYGVEQFDAIINPPQCAILAVGSATQQPVITDGELTIATIMNASLSLNHQVIDGAVGAQFLGLIRDQLQHSGNII